MRRCAAAETAVSGAPAGADKPRRQLYRGLVFMDFDQRHMEEHGLGRWAQCLPLQACQLCLSLGFHSTSGACRYTPLDPGLLPELWLMIADDPSDSGSVHSTVRQRWQAGDQELRRNMAAVAELAEQGRCNSRFWAVVALDQQTRAGQATCTAEPLAGHKN